jgi:regulator of replication initiation timing
VASRGNLGWMSAGDPVGRVEQLEQEVASLQRRLDRSLGENERLAQDIARMQKLLEEAVAQKETQHSSVLPRRSETESQNSGA